MKFKASFNQAVDGVERVEVLIDADTTEEALQKLDAGEFERYLVVDTDFARTQQIGTVELVQVN